MAATCIGELEVHSGHVNAMIALPHGAFASCDVKGQLFFFKVWLGLRATPRSVWCLRIGRRRVH